jgi:type I restriction enzyme M protein
MQKLKAGPDDLRANLVDYLNSFSANMDVFNRFKFENEIATMDEKGPLYLVVSQFADIDLHPSKFSNAEMGDLFEELLRKFAEASNEAAGEHFTRRDAIRLMVNVLFAEDSEALSAPGMVRSLYDLIVGTGGMLSVAEEYLHEHNPQARLTLYGQEINDGSYAICKSGMTAHGQDPTDIKLGDTLVDDPFAGRPIEYCLFNPPYGVDWKASAELITTERLATGTSVRFGAGVPSIRDGQMLFLSHLVFKLRPVKDGGGRGAIVLNGSPRSTAPGRMSRKFAGPVRRRGLLRGPATLIRRSQRPHIARSPRARHPGRGQHRPQFLESPDLHYAVEYAVVYNQNTQHKIADKFTDNPTVHTQLVDLLGQLVHAAANQAV